MIEFNPFTLEGRTVLITGASSGIGRAAAIACAKMGASIIAVGRNTERLNETLAELEGGDRHSAVVCDLTSAEALDELAENLPELQGVVLNAGIDKKVPVKFIKEADLQNIVGTNALSPILLLQRLLRKKRIAKGASIVLTASISALGAAATGIAAYAASKGALISYARVAALELAARGIRVNTVCPGVISTPLTHDVLTGHEDDVAADYPLGRVGTPDDVAWAMVYLLSDASSWVTGTNLVIDGGLTLS